MDIPRLHTPPTEVTNDPQERMNMVLDQEHYNWYGSFPAAANSEHYRTYPDGRGGSGVDASGVAAASQEHWGQEDGGSASWFLEQRGSNDDAADFQRGFYAQSPAYAYFPDESHDAQPAEVGTAPPWGAVDGLDIDNSGRGFYTQPPDDFVRGFYMRPPDDSAVESHGAPPAEVGTAPEDPSSRLLRSPGLTIYNLNNYLSYVEFALGPGKYTNHSSREQPSRERPKNKKLDNKSVSALITGSRGQINGWVNANGRPAYQPTSDRSEAARKGHETKGPEGRSAAADNAHATKGSAGRKAAVQNATEARRRKAAERRDAADAAASRENDRR
ncbi:hypothetical protein [Dictyobacter arantiisoli]|uniref:Uncharacterized protein n=1 Tax=Dictyobacter arantiisoli TaxID=2014874 RepID=A0A5A5TL55_9CHLR|nr:hypothetical protein [Dictyobacter arantiisoli]GCF12055.1 hypothetical protein KDI_56190 [Dictyobacter arantiisoli]